MTLKSTGVLVVGGRETARHFERLAITADAKIVANTQFWGEVLRLKIMRNSGRPPGPRVITGRYQNDWSLVMSRTGKGPRAAVTNGQPQMMRLEFGFVGTDSLGRTYHQAPRPHIRPAFTEVEELFVNSTADAVVR